MPTEAHRNIVSLFKSDLEREPSRCTMCAKYKVAELGKITFILHYQFLIRIFGYSTI